MFKPKNPEIGKLQGYKGRGILEEMDEERDPDKAEVVGRPQANEGGG